MTQRESPSQTAGPYVHIGLMPNHAGLPGLYDGDLGAGPIMAEGQPVTLRGRILDGEGASVTDAVLEVWQADGTGTPGIWARRSTDGPDGDWVLDTVRPGPMRFDGGWMAPHIALWIVARGINLGLQTRIYFPEDDHSADAVLAQVPPGRRRTLMAVPDADGYRFDIHLQGPDETVFLNI
ncbi:protocatechuate 3,4-dioxygenase subunit alpha [Jannaschia pagri]|uniref:Protocatechuate 3,4-dioxygenase subunit alpha n=1 Tax=Jannaschia pagri TaxID=2829797 RepID=A0ABQ4NJT1_9RHOB|nr:MULTISPECIES: protocatechuate 3,4-dioxygenase subunit alpha [unclassified Jannaschia]GIT90822.1 protocatechuate 3,4-dioxygenase subunit alpha [Jannaschia sp. AI_61]GIT94654.1 protocatechuate 3,4-dioxygenase subunit alpha [Jannaschia sp. AI_62]